ncbi:MAG: flagellar basal body P-ring formation chaperone FlgA [Gemmatimonadaceae bacterium]
MSRARVRTPARIALATTVLALVFKGTTTVAGAQDAPRAARSLERGAEIAAADVVIDSAGTAGAPSVVGWVTRRVIREGETLRPPAIGRPATVRAGTTITVRIRAARIEVTRSATALTDGAPGDTIPVRLDRATRGSAVVLDGATASLLPARKP